MAVMWILHELLTIAMFWNLPALHLQEQLETAEENCENTEPVNTSDSQPALVDAERASTDCDINPALIPQEPVHVTSSAVRHASTDQQLNVSDTSSVTMSNECIEEAEVFMNAEQDSSSIVAATAAVRDSSARDAETVPHLSWPGGPYSSPSLRTHSDSSLHQRRQFYGSVQHNDVDRNNVLPPHDQTNGYTDASGVSSVGGVEVPPGVCETPTAAAEPQPQSDAVTWRYYYDGQFIQPSDKGCK